MTWHGPHHRGAMRERRRAKHAAALARQRAERERDQQRAECSKSRRYATYPDAAAALLDCQIRRVIRGNDRRQEQRILQLPPLRRLAPHQHIRPAPGGRRMTPTPINLGPHRGRCRSCDAPILWATTATGKTAPINPDPSDVGNVMLTAAGDQLQAGTLGLTQAAGARAAGKQLHTSHFKDCPDADRHRKRVSR